MNKHIAHFADFSFSRNSKTRRYSHVVVARQSAEAAQAAIDAHYHNEAEAKNYSYYSQQAVNHRGFEISAYDYGGLTVLDHHFRGAGDFLAAYPTLESFLAAQRADRKRRFLQAVDAGQFDEWVAVGWHGRWDLAVKKCEAERNKNFWADVRILEVSIS
jgi:hypothetical protein